MNFFDMIIVVVLIYCIIRGVFRGLIKEVASIVGVVAGFFIAVAYHENVSPLLAGWLDPGYVRLAAFVVVFLGVFLGVTLLGMLIRLVVKAALLSVVDRIFGAVFGGMKAVLLVTLVYLLMVTFLPGGERLLRDSKLAPPVVELGRVIVEAMPKGVKTTYQKKIEEFKKNWKRKT